MFTPLDNYIDWTGFYRIPPNNESYYHAYANGTGYVRWSDADDNDKNYQCPFKMDDATSKLLSAINACKRKFSFKRAGGGKFVINEYGLVIVPIANGGKKYILPKLIGRWKGSIQFEDPDDDDKLLSLDPDGYDTGDDWNLPYLGIKYNLSKTGNIYFYFQNDGGGKPIYLPASADATNLISDLRKIRPQWGPMTFVVNNSGAVIAKADDGDWTPKFVCKLDTDNWFSIEDILFLQGD